MLLSLALALGKMYFLARYLSPKELGILAIVTLIFTLLELVSFWGLDSSIFHVSKLSLIQTSTLFWLYFLVGFVLYAFIRLTSIPITEFFGWQELTAYINFLGLIVWISALGKTRFSVENRKMRFKLMAMVTLIAEFLSVMLTLYLVINGQGLWGVVYGIALSSLLRYGYYFVSELLQKGFSYFYFSFFEAGRFLKVGSYSLLSKLTSQFSSNLDMLLIERITGLEGLGKYSIAKHLALQPFRFSGPIIQKIFTPYLANFKDKRVALKEHYLNLVRINSGFNLVALAAFLILADIIVRVLYGETYHSIVKLTSLLSIYLFLRTVNSPVMILSVVKGLTHYDFQWSILQTALIPLFVYLGSFYGLEGVAFSLIIMRLVLYYPSWYFFGRRLAGVSLRELWRANFVFTPNSLRFVKHILLKGRKSDFTSS